MKKRLTQLALAVSSLPFLASPVLADVDPQAPSITPVEAKRGFFADIGKLINGALNFVMVIGALLVFLYLIMGGIEWITSGGDKSKTESARNKITAAVVGLVILAASYAILMIVMNFLGFSDFADLFSVLGS